MTSTQISSAGIKVIVALIPIYTAEPGGLYTYKSRQPISETLVYIYIFRSVLDLLD